MLRKTLYVAWKAIHYSVKVDLGKIVRVRKRLSRGGALHPPSVRVRWECKGGGKGAGGRVGSGRSGEKRALLFLASYEAQIDQRFVSDAVLSGCQRSVTNNAGPSNDSSYIGLLHKWLQT